MKERGKGLVAGVVASAVFVGLIGTAAATVGSRTVQADYSDIKVILNGEKITPKDANGLTVEPFAVNGTTYLPVRAICDAVGLDVGWDGETNTVLLYGDNSFTKKDAEKLALYHDLFRLADSFSDLGISIDFLKEAIILERQGIISDSDLEDAFEVCNNAFEKCNAFSEQMIDLCTDDESLQIMSDLIDAQSCLVEARNSLLSSGWYDEPSGYFDKTLQADYLIFDAKTESQNLYSSLYRSLMY